MAQNDKNNDAEECAVPNSEAVNLETLFPPPFLPEKGLPTARVAYSDRTAAVMAKFARLAYIPFEQGESDEAFYASSCMTRAFICSNAIKAQKNKNGAVTGEHKLLSPRVKNLTCLPFEARQIFGTGAPISIF